MPVTLATNSAIGMNSEKVIRRNRNVQLYLCDFIAAGAIGVEAMGHEGVVFPRTIERITAIIITGQTALMIVAAEPVNM